MDFFGKVTSTIKNAVESQQRASSAAVAEEPSSGDHNPAAGSPVKDPAEQQRETLQAIVLAAEADLQKERSEFAAFKEKVATWQQRVKQVNTEDRQRILDLQQELHLYKAVSASPARADDGDRAPANLSMSPPRPEQAAAGSALSQQSYVQQLIAEALQQDRTAVDDLRKQLTQAIADKAAIEGKVKLLEQRLVEETAKTESTNALWEAEFRKVAEHHKRDNQLHETLEAELKKQVEFFASRVEEVGDATRVRELEAEIQSLENHVAQQAEMTHLMQKELREREEASQTASAELKNKMSVLQVHAEALQMTNATAKAEIQDLKSQLSTYTAGIDGALHQRLLPSPVTPDTQLTQQLQAQVQRLLTEQQTTEAQIADWKAKVKTVKIEDNAKIAALTDEVAQLKAQLDGGAAENAALTESLKAELASIQQQRAVDDEKTQDWKAKVKAAKLEDNAKIAALTDEVAQLKAQLDGGAAENAALTESLKAELAREKEAVESITADVDFLNDEVNRLQMESSTLSERYRALVEEAATLKQQLEGKCAAMSAHEVKVGTWRARVKRVKDEDDAKIAAGSATVADLTQLLEGGKLRETELIGKLDGAEAAAAAAEEDVAALRALLEADLERMQQWQAKVKEVKTADDATVAALERQNSELQAQLAQVEERGEAACKLLTDRCLLAESRFTESLDELAQKLASAVERAEDYEQKCDLLRQELKRQRDSTQRDRMTAAAMASGGSVVGAGPGGATAGTAAAAGPTTPVQPSPTTSGGAATAYAFEKDVMSMATQQSAKEQELRHMRQQLRDCERRNTELTAENDHNSKTVVQLLQQVEAAKANERRGLSVEYAKNIVLQFLCTSHEDARLRMVPAIATALEFSATEKKDVQKALPRCPKFY